MEKEEIINKIDEGFKQQTGKMDADTTKILGKLDNLSVAIKECNDAVDRNVKALDRMGNALDEIIEHKKTGKRKEYAYFVAVMVLYICLFYIAFSL